VVIRHNRQVDQAVTAATYYDKYGSTVDKYGEKAGKYSDSTTSIGRKAATYVFHRYVRRGILLYWIAYSRLRSG
jgi:hypothetical protein